MRSFLHFLRCRTLLILFSCAILWGCRQPDDRTFQNTETSTANPQYPGLNQDVDRILYSRHARCRMSCRHISERDVEEILHHGKINTRKIERDSRGTTYPVEGIAHAHHLRIVFAPKGEDTVEVVTCIDLDEEWPCSCN